MVSSERQSNDGDSTGGSGLDRKGKIFLKEGESEAEIARELFDKQNDGEGKGFLKGQESTVLNVIVLILILAGLALLAFLWFRFFLNSG